MKLVPASCATCISSSRSLCSVMDRMFIHDEPSSIPVLCYTVIGLPARPYKTGSRMAIPPPKPRPDQCPAKAAVPFPGPHSSYHSTPAGMLFALPGLIASLPAG